MEKCKFCKYDKLNKNGKVRGMQRYICKKCQKNQVYGDNRVKYSDKMRNLAVVMYLNNAGFRAIGRVLNVPFQLVSYWIRKAGKIVEEKLSKQEEKPREIEVLEMDELYTYIQKKNNKYEYGLLLIGEEMKLLHII